MNVLSSLRREEYYFPNPLNSSSLAQGLCTCEDPVGSTKAAHLWRGSDAAGKIKAWYLRSMSSPALPDTSWPLICKSLWPFFSYSSWKRRTQSPQTKGAFQQVKNTNWKTQQQQQKNQPKTPTKTEGIILSGQRFLSLLESSPGW